MHISDIVDEYFNLENMINEHFGSSNIQFYGGLWDGRDCYWYLDGGEILYADELEHFEDNCCGGEVYGSCVWSSDPYTVITYDNGCGDKCTVLLHNEMRQEEHPGDDDW